jgi:hypothetical protein
MLCGGILLAHVAWRLFCWLSIIVIDIKLAEQPQQTNQPKLPDTFEGSAVPDLSKEHRRP